MRSKPVPGAWSDVVTVAAFGTFITIDAMKNHMRIGHAEDDQYIETLIKVAREEIEIYTNNSILPETRTLTLDDFPRDIYGVIQIPRLPVTNIDAIRYIDPAGALITYSSANYQVDLQARPARIMPAANIIDWPSTKDDTFGAVQIQYDCGYAVIPENLILAGKLIVSELYWNRHNEAAVTDITAAERLCYPYRLWT